jgi:hypothetical protein
MQALPANLTSNAASQALDWMQALWMKGCASAFCGIPKSVAFSPIVNDVARGDTSPTIAARTPFFP